METKELAGYYGFAELPEDMGVESLSMKDEAFEPDTAAEKVRERLKGRSFRLFVSCDVEGFDERQLPLTDFIRINYGIVGSLRYEPILGVAHYMSRRGLFEIAPENIPGALKAMFEYPYHFFALISAEAPEKEKIDSIISETRGMALLPHIARKWLLGITGEGAEFIHAARAAGQVSLNCFFKK